eukprot:gene23462-17288_t
MLWGCVLSKAFFSTAATSKAFISTAATSKAFISTAATSKAFISTAATSKAFISTAATSKAFISTAATSKAFISTAATSKAFISTAATSKAFISTAATSKAFISTAATTASKPSSPHATSKAFISTAATSKAFISTAATSKAFISTADYYHGLLCSTASPTSKAFNLPKKNKSKLASTPLSTSATSTFISQHYYQAFHSTAALARPSSPQQLDLQGLISTAVSASLPFSPLLRHPQPPLPPQQGQREEKKRKQLDGEEEPMHSQPRLKLLNLRQVLQLKGDQLRQVYDNSLEHMAQEKETLIKLLSDREKEEKETGKAVALRGRRKKKNSRERHEYTNQLRERKGGIKELVLEVLQTQFSQLPVWVVYASKIQQQLEIASYLKLLSESTPSEQDQGQRQREIVVLLEGLMHAEQLSALQEHRLGMLKVLINKPAASNPTRKGANAKEFKLFLQQVDLLIKEDQQR